MATYNFGETLRNFGSRPDPLADPLDPFAPAYNPTARALRQVASPVPYSGMFGTGSLSRLPTLGAPSGDAQGAQIVPGPLGTWERDRGRRHQQTGKFGVNLLGSGQGFAPGGATPYSEPPDAAAQLRGMADPANPDNRGFIEGLLGTVGGLFGEGGKAVAGTIGSGFDLPLEAIGNLFGVGTSLLTGQEQWADNGRNIDSDLMEVYRQAERENPINGLLLWGHVAKAQFQRDVASGARTEAGLMQDVGPAVALTDFLGMILNVGFGTPARAVQRGIAGASVDDENLQRVENAVRRGETVTEDPETGQFTSSDGSIVNPAYARLQMRLERGDFGAPGTKRARDLMRDALVVEGAVLRDPGDAQQVAGEGGNQFLPFGMTGQGLLDMAFGVVTDPTIIAGAGVGAVAKAAKMGTMAANAKFWQAIPQAALPDVMQAVERAAMRLGKFDNPDRAWAALGRTPGAGTRARAASTVDSGFEARVYREALNDPALSGAGFRPDAEAALGYIERWRSTWEPALRPVTETVRNLNDPFRMFGGTRVSKAQSDVFSAHATEGVIRGQGSLDAHANVQRALGAIPGNFLSLYDKGLGVAAAFETRVFHRNGLMADLRRRIRNGDASAHDLMNQYLPDDVLTARMAGSTAGDIATGLEKQALRYRPLYLATERGGDAAALTRAREEAAGRLQLMGMTRDDATRVSGGMNRDEIALLDLSYFGHAMDRFVSARATAMRTPLPKGALDPEELTMLGPRQLTAQMAEQVLDSVSRGAIDEVRAALRKYDILFENLGENLDDAKLLRAVDDLLRDQIDAGALPRDIDNFDGLTDEMRRWAEENQALGYKVGFRPADDQMWRLTKDADGRVVGINPWVEVSSTASDVGTYTRAQRAKDLMFHAVRGERIMADARVRLAQHTSQNWGLARGQSDALFARFLRMSQEAGITPRGLSPEQVFQIVKTHGIDDDIIKGIGVREAVEALLYAFEGKWQHVGLTQKFTGSAKTTFGGQGNWLGQVAEKIYPLVRFTLNPLFQAQEMTEPFILNLMRGIRPGLRPTEMDERTLQLVETIIRDSKYAYDDQIEYGATLLWGADSAREAFGPNSRLGKMFARMDILNVKEVKRVNYARAMRRTLGREFHDAITRVSPDIEAKLRAHYQTDDWGDIAVRYLTEKGWVETPTATLKPDYLGARNAVELDKVARHFDGVANADELRAAVREGRWDGPAFRDVLVEAGADPDFADRAFVTASVNFSPDEWWDEWRINFRAGNRTATNADRALFKAVAAVHNMTEAEYLAKHFADVPMSVDEKALMALADTEKRWFQFMTDIVDSGGGRTQAADARLTQFRTQFAHTADREHFAIIDNDGNVLDQGGQYTPWTESPNGSIDNAGLGAEITPSLPLATGKVLVHNHPSHNPFSPADISTAVQYDVKEMVVTSPGVTYSLRPGDDLQGWWTDEFMAEFGVPPTTTEAVPGLGHQILTEQYWQQARVRMNSEWMSIANQVAQEMATSPFYRSRQSALWAEYIDAVATNTAVQKLADRWGWKFDSVTDYRLPADPAERHRMLTDMAQNPPHGYANELPFSYRSEELVRVEARAGTSVAYEYGTDLLPWLPRNLSDEQQRLVQDTIDDWYRTSVAPRFGVLVTDVVHGRGGWYDVGTGLFSDTVNAVQDVFGTREQVRAYAAALGYNSKQWAVFTSRPKVGASVANYDAGEAWAYQFVADRVLSADEAVELQRLVAKHSPDVAGWGSSIVRTADGRTAIRFIEGGRTGMVDEATFRSTTSQFVDTKELNDALDAVEHLGYKVGLHHDVVEFDRLYNDWEAAPDGSSYKGVIAEHRPDVVGELDGGLAVEARDRLAAALRQHAPAEFDAHLAALRADGVAVPEFGIPGEFTPAPLSDRLSISIPGGRESLTPTREFSLWEQQLLKAQTINASDLYNADPDLYLGLMSAIWKSKYKAIEGTGPGNAAVPYNMFAFAAMTANAALDVTEGAYALLRATPGGASNQQTLARLSVRAKRIIGKLPERFRRNPAHIGLKFQLDEGIRLSGLKVHQAKWLDMESRDIIDRLGYRVNEAMRNAPDDEAREALAKAIQKRLDGDSRTKRVRATKRGSAANADMDLSFLDDLDAAGINTRRGVNVQVHPWVTERITDSYDGTILDDFVSIGRPAVRFKGTATNQAWGRVLRWLESDIWTSDNPAVQRFMQIQPWESRDAYALRMSSILPGIDLKTAMMAIQTGGPGQVAHGAMDTHIIRYVVQQAAKRGELGILRKPWVHPGPRPVPRSWDEIAAMETGSDEALAAIEENAVARRAWSAEMKRGIALGQIDPQEAEDLGLTLERGARDFEDLTDQTFYHATPAMSRIKREGLRTRDEAGITALGGGSSDTISLTDDPALAERIADVLKEARLVIRGEIGLDDLIQRAKDGGFYDQLMRSFGSGADGLTMEAREAAFRRKYTTKQVPEDTGMASRWLDVPMTAEELPQGRFDAYRAFLITQESAGGPADPMFFGANIDDLAKMDPDDIGVVEVRGKPGAKGQRLNSMGEVRVFTGEALDVGASGTLLDRLSPGYAAHISEEAGRLADEASTAFKSPEGDRIFLVPDGKWRGRPWSPEKEAVMRSRLHLIEDPELRAMYDDPEVLRLVSETGGKVNRWGGDYAVIEDYFNTTLRADEVARLRAAGHNDAADAVERMTGGQWQWFKWDQIRSAAGTPLDPHVGITRGAELMPPRVGADLDRNIQTSRLKSPYTPRAMVLQQIDGRILGANQIMDDTRRVLLATQHADGRTGLHELAHVFEQHLDPSMRSQVLAEFRAATGSRRRTWSREVSEWWADSLLDYARARGKGKNPALRSSFDYFRKTLDGIETAIKADAERVVLARTRNSAIQRATKAVEKVTPGLREAERAAKAAQRALAQANRELRRARGRAGLDVLESRAAILNDEVAMLDAGVKDAKAALREAVSGAKAADMRAQQAIGTPSAGGLRASASRASRKAQAAQDAVTSAEKALAKARDQYNRASRKVAGARRRVPVETFEKTRDAARAASETAEQARRKADAAVKAARKALDDAKALPLKPARAKVAPLPMSDAMRKMWDDLTTPPATPDPTAGTGQPYDVQQEAVYQAARHALSRAEEDAFRLHYYKRGRSFVERSINHPYFGLYPASYMWGKILPEMVRFLTKTPFGLDAPLGGLALSHNIYRGVLTQQQYDPEFRARMVEQKDLWHFAALLTPSLPWEVPVNAPLWARRFAEAGLVYEDKVDALTAQYGDQPIPEDKQPPMMDLETMTRTGREMLNYAFGPAAAVEQVGAAIGMGASGIDQTLSYAESTVNDILASGRTGEPLAGEANGGIVPTQGLGIPGP